MTEIGAQLSSAGMSDHEALAKARLFTRCVGALGALGGASASAFFVPGRIEILGKHTDYAGGRSLLCAVERGFVAVAMPRTDTIVRVIDAVRGETRELALDPQLGIPRMDWSAYVAASVRRIARNFPRARRGADIALASDLPSASGMSSSSALSTAVFLALDAVNELSADPAYREAIDSREALAGYLGTIENGQSFGALAGDQGVGTFGGSEDHTAILCCRSGFVSRYSFAPVRAEGEIPFPSGHAFAVAYSGIAAEKGSRAQVLYNELSLSVRQLVTMWNAATHRADRSLAEAIESAPDAPVRMRELLRASELGNFSPQRLRDRFDQFLMESYEIIPRAAEALARADLATLGALVDRSQQGAETLLRNQVPETIALARSARREGADAASAFGGGFGGSVWALVGAPDAEAFVTRWRDAYRSEFAEAAARAEFIVTRPGPGAMALRPSRERLNPRIRRS
ncbi:MAG: galactokinase family protein [Gemmatimonadaceae bacterium]